MSLGSPEIIIIFVLVLLLFGPSKLPELARTVGKGMREFRRATSDIQSHFNFMDDEPENLRGDSNDNSSKPRDTRDSSPDVDPPPSDAHPTTSSVALPDVQRAEAVEATRNVDAIDVDAIDVDAMSEPDDIKKKPE